MGSSKSSTPEAPKVPTYQEQISSYIDSVPQLAEAQLKAIQQYGGQTALAQQQAYASVSPNQAALPEELAGIARQGMTGDLPPELQEQYLSNIRANLGSNAGSQIGATALAREMYNVGESRRNNYMNIAAQLAGRTPTFEAQKYDTSLSAGNSLTAQQNLTSQAMNLYNSQMTANANQEAPWYSTLLGSFGGSLVSGVGSDVANMVVPGLGTASRALGKMMLPGIGSNASTGSNKNQGTFVAQNGVY